MAAHEGSEPGRPAGPARPAAAWRKRLYGYLSWLAVAALLGFFVTLFAMEFHFM